jgi:hypothetical protein
MPQLFRTMIIWQIISGGKDQFQKDKFTNVHILYAVGAGDDFSAENLTIENTAGRGASGGASFGG